ncbi:uncharacterized protein PRCAT00001277001 [Priceomyces carsonii]|uniref:uncharacterized protein n=1 Tax=Priceomyces carsonii TaxID=28549 RepID=UPI002ED99994|nr:unnamed protein product [Priceomyces carsonii]
MQLPEPYYNDDPKSFAYSTVRKRWPTIIKEGIEHLMMEIENQPSLKESGGVLIAKLELLLTSFKKDEKVTPFDNAAIKKNGCLVHYNKSLEKLNEEKTVTWLTGPWLYLECYLYELIHLYFISSEHSYWRSFDIFEAQKNSSFQHSLSGVLELCKRYETLSDELQNQDVSPDALQILFNEFISISLWGNATDLSLLAGSVSIEEIKSVQAADFRKKNEEKIIVNDLNQAWNHLVKENTRRIDIVLDNAGFELFADLIFGLFALDSNLVTSVHIHCKKIPWFVSDTLPKDFDNLIAQLGDLKFFTEIYNEKQDAQALISLHDRLRHYIESNQIRVESHDFWTSDSYFWEIPRTEDLYKNLLNSDLVIFKGDLNYRKLTGDLQWPKTTPFSTAIMDLADSKLPILSLRTCKADVVVGLPEGLNEELIEKYKSMGNEVGEFWSSSGKWAVISFCKGS